MGRHALLTKYLKILFILVNVNYYYFLIDDTVSVFITVYIELACILKNNVD